MSGRQITIIANWKANLPPSEEVALAREIAVGVGGTLAPTGGALPLRLLLAPSALGLVPVASLLRREFAQTGIDVAAQDISRNGAGAFTGEIPAEHLVGLAPAVIVGHSERRRDHGETDEVVGAKLARVVAAGLSPVLCLGDDLATGDASARTDRVLAQCTAALEAARRAGSSTENLITSGLVIAYEPIWAIGTGTAASVELAEGIAEALRAELRNNDLPVLYGGSVDAPSAATWFVGPRGRTAIDGLLVGGASLQAARLLAIIRAGMAVVEPA
jgi:triosephosphate isomerase